ncbi:MAG: LpxI family protein [Hyphomicrobiales bacterium]
MVQQTPSRIAILAGGGSLPVEAAVGAQEAGHEVLVVAIADEADLSPLPPSIEQSGIEWGQIGALIKMLADYKADRLVIVGSISKRPDYRSLRLDWGAVQLLPKILTIVLGGGDATVLDKIAGLFFERGFELAGVQDVAPSLIVGEGHLAGPKANATVDQDADSAAHAAWTTGHLDMGQGAVTVNGRIVAMEGAEGTDGLLERVQGMREAKRFTSKGRAGVLAKCLRPKQDMRLDVPAIGPQTIINAHAAGLSGVVLEAGGVLISQREKTFALCAEHGISLFARPRASFVPADREDVLA